MSFVRKETGRHRELVLERDRGICQACGVDCLRLEQWLRGLPLIDSSRPWKYGAVRADTQLAFRRVLGRHQHRALVLLGRLWGVRIPNVKTSLWESHHAKAVVLGGGGCGVDGLVTLCRRCHKEETADLAGQLARRPSKGVGRGFAILLALLLVACGDARDTLERDVAEVRAQIAEAFSRHHVQTSGETQTIIGAGALTGNMIGETVICGNTAAIVIEEIAPHVIAHELGHAMGLAHEDDTTSVMHGSAAVMSGPEAAEQLAELCMRHQCAVIVQP